MKVLLLVMLGATISVYSGCRRLRYEVVDGKAVISNFQSAKGDLIIPRELGGFPVAGISRFAFYHSDKLTSVAIPDTVSEIGFSAFDDCFGLTNAIIPSSVTKIGDCAFRYCYNLKAVSLSAGLKSIGQSAFSECTGLTEVTIPNGVTEIGGWAFQGCVNLKSVNIPDSVKKIYFEAFNDCEGLGKGIINIDNCILTVNGNCLENVVLPTGTRIIAGSAFSGRNELRSITIPEGVTWIGDFAFSGCENLKSVNIPRSVTEIDFLAFDGCKGLGDGIVIVDNCLLTINGDCPENVIIPQGTRLIANSTLKFKESLKSIAFPDSITNIHAYAFLDCTNLTSVTIPKGITTVEKNAFCGCENLKTINVSNGDIDRVRALLKSSCFEVNKLEFTETLP